MSYFLISGKSKNSKRKLKRVIRTNYSKKQITNKFKRSSYGPLNIRTIKRSTAINKVRHLNPKRSRYTIRYKRKKYMIGFKLH